MIANLPSRRRGWSSPTRIDRPSASCRPRSRAARTKKRWAPRPPRAGEHGSPRHSSPSQVSLYTLAAFPAAQRVLRCRVPYGEVVSEGGAVQTQQPAAPDCSPGPGPVTAFVQPVGIGLLIALAFVLIYLTALHKPQPHNLPVGVVAPADVVAQLQRSLSARTGDAVVLRPAADVIAARHQVKRGHIVAAYLPGQGRGQGSRLLVAGAQGTAVSQAVTGIFTGVA